MIEYEIASSNPESLEYGFPPKSVVLGLKLVGSGPLNGSFLLSANPANKAGWGAGAPIVGEVPKNVFHVKKFTASNSEPMHIVTKFDTKKELETKKPYPVQDKS